ncbi:MAG TPA: PEP/pyruvate-binding domain-containing protein [Polyangium sp.]|nr:PEP/pyruvate-binding domain-containing protein [Polyangium sp.]
MDTVSPPQIVSLLTCSDPRAGGKALHLAKLFGAGLTVPDGFVVLGAQPDSLPAGIDEAHARLGGPVAVRSSALTEDSVDTSFAGQYDTFLGIDGAEAVKNAIVRCLQSARAMRADAYRNALHVQRDESMSVVVQRMVDARAAGVLFTRNPVTGAQNEIVIEATQGLGDALVSGHVAAHRLVLSREGKVLTNDTETVQATIDVEMAGRLVREAILAETHFGHPLDLEWAIDEKGTIHWLQARPITTSDLPGLDELDSTMPDLEKHVFTNYNIGEVLPGAATPLGSSITLDSFNEAMGELYEKFGIPKERLVGEPLIVQFSGHMFLHLNLMYLAGLYILGSSKEALDHSLAGRTLEHVDVGPSASLPTRAFNAIKYFSFLYQARSRFEEFLERTANFDVLHKGEAREIIRAIDAALPIVTESWAAHLHTSSLCGALQGILLGILSGGSPATAEHQAIFSGLLAFVEPSVDEVGTSSLGLPQALERLAAVIGQHPTDAEKITKSSIDEALAWLRSPECSTSVREAFEDFLLHHGHRCVREAEIRQTDWREDPRPLLANVQGMLVNAQSFLSSRSREKTQLPPMPAPKRWFAEKIVAESRRALVLRERSKSHGVRCIRKLRPAYLALAQHLVDAGTIPDTDLVFFFTHQELLRFVENPDPALVRRALHRRRLHPQKMALQFPRVFRGKPIPIDESATTYGTGDVMHGTPVSRGLVVGLARVARSPEEAKFIVPGEILVVPYTDVGWAPYFLRAAGLASEIGGTLSHGAVVARECGLPAIVNLPGATRMIRTGDKLRLDGNTGELRILERAVSTS